MRSRRFDHKPNRLFDRSRRRFFDRDPKSVRSGVVYILSNPIHTRWCKIGYTSRKGGAAARAEDYGAQHGMDGWEVHAEYETEFPIIVEQAVHERLSGRRIKLWSGGKEVFDVRPHEAEPVVLEEVTRLRTRLDFELHANPAASPAVPSQTPSSQQYAASRTDSPAGASKARSLPPFGELSPAERARAWNLAVFMTAKDLRAKRGSRGEAARVQTTTLLDQHGAALAQSWAQTVYAVEGVRGPVYKLSKDDQIDFTHRMETGQRQATPELQKVSDILRVLIDGWTRKVQSLGRGYLANAIHGYMGHVWGNYAEWAQRLLPPTVGDVQGKAPAPLAEQPSLASKVFLKERGFPTQFEAIKAGLIPITYNPVDFQLLKLREMQKFYHGIKLADDMKRTEVARWVPAGMERAAADEGLEPLDDRLFRLGLTGDASPAGFGRMEPGNWYAAEPAARLFNSFMRHSLDGDPFNRGEILSGGEPAVPGSSDRGGSEGRGGAYPDLAGTGSGHAEYERSGKMALVVTVAIFIIAGLAWLGSN